MQIDRRGALRTGGLAALIAGTMLPALAPLAVRYARLHPASHRSSECPRPPRTAAAASPASGESLPSQEEIARNGASHWAFRPLQPVAPPVVSEKGLVRTPIDRFILAGLERRGLEPSPQISRRRLIRRAYFDLLGLPPSPEEIEQFVQDPSPNAYPHLVDRLLANPHYGERWGRFWLDLARYADSSGYEADRDRLDAYPYRDFVIRSLNQDMPYDRFVRLQIAGDLLQPGSVHAAAATGFCTNGPTIMPGHSPKDRWDELDDQVSTTGSAILGLTVGCARCHDHKFDPISQADYYRVAAAFAGSHRTDVLLDPASAKPYQRAMLDWHTEMTQARSRLAAFHKGLPQTPSAEQFGRIEQLESDVNRVEAAKPAPPAEALSLTGEIWSGAPVLRNGNPDQSDQTLGPGFLARLGGSAPEWTRGYARERVASRKPNCVPDAPRVRLAEWLTDTRHGAGSLVARVIVNRVWQHHFGQGLVRTPSDFGLHGDRPDHPDLLDWLASEFVSAAPPVSPYGSGGVAEYGGKQPNLCSRNRVPGHGGGTEAHAHTPTLSNSQTSRTEAACSAGMQWSLKKLHRLIMLSAAYQEGTRWNEEAARVDPDNRLLWRREPQRLEAEPLRDSLLAVSGCLNPNMYGPGIHPWIPPDAIFKTEAKYGELWPANVVDGPATWRRTVYVFVKRSNPFPFSEAWDAPSSTASCAQRSTSNVAPQALTMLNDRFVRDQAEHFAERVRREARPDRSAQVTRAYELALGRAPRPTEADAGLAFLAAHSPRVVPVSAGSTSDPALADFCQVLFCLNEFAYVD